MEAKDTVMTPLQIHKKPKDKSYLEAQAEISFKAGIKEVVDWIRQNSDRLNALEDSTRFKAWREFEAKLKEWEIDA